MTHDFARVFTATMDLREGFVIHFIFTTGSRSVLSESSRCVIGFVRVLIITTGLRSVISDFPAGHVKTLVTLPTTTSISRKKRTSKFFQNTSFSQPTCKSSFLMNRRRLVFYECGCCSEKSSIQEIQEYLELHHDREGSQNGPDFCVPYKGCIGLIAADTTR